MLKFDAIVVGGGHAGIEALFALAHKGFKVALVTLDKTKLAMMPCNPAIGGPAKGIITREVDALGGMQGLLADQAMIQIKMLNASKGPAVRALRAQIDKDKYSQLVAKAIAKQQNITLIEDMVNELNVRAAKISSLTLASGQQVQAKTVIITTGTYMNSSILRGQDKHVGGPDGQKTSAAISASMQKLGIELQRLKTGTPPRVLASSIDFSQVEKEVLSPNNLNFSHRSKLKLSHQIYCHLTYTNEETHKIVRANVEQSSMYSGLITGVGPRYCPSIEDKIVRFQDKKRHQIFYEPETADGKTIYINGFSTSMPIAIQDQMLRTLPGMKHAIVTKWAYAIEYDAINPLQLKPSLELKSIAGLFMAGQINGTSGYEEAAAQGLMAGLNAALWLEQKPPLILTRDQAYIGVLIDDLVTRGTNEPYRMLTSRAEYRLLLRNDNADQRLSKIGFQVGLITAQEYAAVKAKYQAIEQEIARLKTKYVSPNSSLSHKYKITNGPSYYQVLTRPHVDYRDLTDSPFGYEIATHARLAGYIRKQHTQARKMLRLEKLPLPMNLDYEKIINLATEARQKLAQIRPRTIGQASRIAGINPADIQMLMFWLEYRKRDNSEN